MCKEQKSKLESDLISRQAAIDALCRECAPVGYECQADCTEVEILRKLPPVTPTERTGTWRWVDFWTKDRTRTRHGIECSECGECYDWDDPYVFPSYCSACGAKMEGVEK